MSCIHCTSEPDALTPCPCSHAPCVHDANREREFFEAFRASALREELDSRRHGEFDRAVAYQALAVAFPCRCHDWTMYMRERRRDPAVEQFAVIMLGALRQ